MVEARDPLAARARLFVALDVADVAAAAALVSRLGDSVSHYKVGLELVMNGGLSIVRRLKDQGKSVFLDMKLLDIGTTVEKATRNAAHSGADFLTIHAIDTQTIEAAARGAEGTTLQLLGVTVLTNLTEHDLAEQGILAQPEDLVVRRARLAQAAGCHGVIASGQEAGAVRAAVPAPEFLIVTPGIRLPTDDAGDQARVATPERAIRDGATHLVVGRPVTQAADPRAAADVFVQRIATA